MLEWVLNMPLDVILLCALFLFIIDIHNFAMKSVTIQYEQDLRKHKSLKLIDILQIKMKNRNRYNDRPLVKTVTD